MKLYQHPISKKTNEFLAWLDDREGEGHLTIDENNEILRAGRIIWEASGLPNNPEADDASVAIARHEYQVMKEKAVVICPQLEHEIRTFDQQDSRFWQHPMNAQIRDFQAWLHDRVDEGRLTYPQLVQILREGYQAYRQAGIPRGPDADEITVAAFRQQIHILKAKTLDFCPTLGDDIRNMPNDRSR